MKEDLQGALKQAMRVYPQGVTVVTTQSKTGPKGITVSSFTSVSLDPPLISISISKSSGMHDTIAGAEKFAVNFLADDQKSVSDRFAGRSGPAERFHGLKHRAGATGSPIIDGVRAAIECTIWRIIEGGDHSIIIGEVLAASSLNSKRPLVYYSQQYTTTELGETPAPPSDIVW
jgi:3-hydroxy-9,10-secoandrosta-1,3,5(10)-triene-9,17-dione monooxygenase reductase component